MSKKLALVHTVSALVPVFQRLSAELLPGVALTHIVDEPLLQRVRQRGHLVAADADRLVGHIAIAEETGAAAALVTCSTISPCVDEIRARVGVPLLKIDEAMIARAIAGGGRIAVIATNRATLEPTREALLEEATRTGREVTVELTLVRGGLDALMSGDSAGHDRLVREAVLTASASGGVIVLAQASMARVLDVIPEAERAVPILSSPHLALERIGQILAEAG